LSALLLPSSAATVNGKFTVITGCSEEESPRYCGNTVRAGGNGELLTNKL